MDGGNYVIMVKGVIKVVKSGENFINMVKPKSKWGENCEQKWRKLYHNSKIYCKIVKLLSKYQNDETYGKIAKPL